MRIYRELEQGSDEWKKVRLGKITGTRTKKVKQANNLGLVDELIAEIITEQVEEFYVNEKMQRGTDTEPIARKEYEELTGLIVEQVGFLLSDKYNWLGFSPDGLINENGIYRKGVEIKCPDTDTHVRYIRQNTLPNEYKDQIHTAFIVNEDMVEMDFVSYDNRFLIKPIHIINIRREEIKEELEETEKALVKFWTKFQKYYNQITF